MDAIAFRGLERLLVVAAATFIAYLGYRLFIKGVSDGPGKLDVTSKFGKIVFSGTGPGLFFMSFGALVLMVSLFTGGAKVDAQANDDLRKAVTTLQEKLNKLEKKAVTAEDIDELKPLIKALENAGKNRGSWLGMGGVNPNFGVQTKNTTSSAN